MPTSTPTARFVLPLAFGLGLLCATADAKKKPALPTPPPAPTACTDFYGTVNGPWLAAHALPTGVDSRSRWDELNELAQRQRLDLGNPASAGTGPASQRLADLVASGLDETAVETAGIQALNPAFEQIGKIRKAKDVAPAIAWLHNHGLAVAFAFDIVPDPVTGKPQARFLPAGLGLVDPAFYSHQDAPVVAVKKAYRDYLAKLLQFAGATPAKAGPQADAVLALETQLAANSDTPANPAVPIALLLKDTQKSYPQLALSDFIAAQNVSANEIRLGQPDFFRTLDERIAKAPADTWKAYLRLQVLNSMAPYLSRDFRDARSQLYDRLIAGQGAPPRGDFVAAGAERESPELFDAAYSERYLPPAQRQRAQAVTDAVRAAFARAVESATWLSPQGKALAKSKLEALDINLGEPAQPLALDALNFDRQQFAGNVLKLRRWQHQRAMARLAAPGWTWPVRQSRPSLNYEPRENRLEVSAAVLQAPALPATAGAADYGAFGALLAQQMSLAVQNPGGVDDVAWVQRSAPLIAQYNAYTAVGTLKVNGSQTLSQNAADLSGLEIAWAAFNAQGKPSPDAAKAFFAAWAGLWARVDRDAALAASLGTAVRAPARWRVNGPLANLPAFGLAYACKAGPMQVPYKNQVALWR